MDLHLLAVGKLKDPGLVALCDTWGKRSRRALPIHRETLRDLDQLWARAEGLDAPIVLADERGQQIDSMTLAGWLERWRDEGQRRVVFAIGDAHGFDEAQRAKATRLLGLSRLTLPHRLAQLVLCEQLYRAGTILAGHPYHHT
jgi:23S rRNA (pseudouridine1915-N3)-methyltransferase